MERRTIMRVTGKVLFVVIAGVFAISWSQTALAQASLATNANMAVQILKRMVCDGDEIIVDGNRCTVMDVRSVD